MDNTDATVNAARDAFLTRFRWHDGHADLWNTFEDGPTLAAIIDGLAAPWTDAGITAVVGIEARGFLLGAAVATRLGAGFHAVRKAGTLFPGDKLTTRTEPDYRGTRHDLALRTTLNSDDVVLLVDDWAERGAQATAARDLVTQTGARWAGVSLLVDQLDDTTRGRLGAVTALVSADDLPDID